MAGARSAQVVNTSASSARSPNWVDDEKAESPPTGAAAGSAGVGFNLGNKLFIKDTAEVLRCARSSTWEVIGELGLAARFGWGDDIAPYQVGKVLI